MTAFPDQGDLPAPVLLVWDSESRFLRTESVGTLESNEVHIQDVRGVGGFLQKPPEKGDRPAEMPTCLTIVDTLVSALNALNAREAGASPVRVSHELYGLLQGKVKNGTVSNAEPHVLRTGGTPLFAEAPSRPEQAMQGGETPQQPFSRPKTPQTT